MTRDENSLWNLGDISMKSDKKSLNYKDCVSISHNTSTYDGNY